MKVGEVFYSVTAEIEFKKFFFSGGKLLENFLINKAFYLVKEEERKSFSGGTSSLLSGKFDEKLFNSFFSYRSFQEN